MSKVIDISTVGGRISWCRKRLNLTQEQLADRMNVTAPLISNYENDKVDISLRVLYELADHLETTVSFLTDGIDLDIGEMERELLVTFGRVKADDRRIFLLKQMEMFAMLE